MCRSIFRVFATVLVIAALTLACNGDDNADNDPTARTPAPDTTAAPTNTPTPTGGDVGFRTFAAQIDAAIRAGDIGFFRERMITVPVDCATAPDAGEIGGPVCPEPDARYDGFATGTWRSEGGIVPADSAATAFEHLFDEQLAGTSDEFGDGAAGVYALNVQTGDYKAAISALVARPADFAGDGPLRAALSTSWVFDDGEWRMEGPLIIAYVLAEDFLRPSPESGYDAWERFAPD